MDQLLHLYSSAPSLHSDSLSDHSGFPPSLPLILLTSLFCPSFTAAMKKAAAIYIFHRCISGGLMTAIKGKALEVIKPTESVSLCMKYMKLLSGGQMQHCLSVLISVLLW